jgi:hypothetical protein
MFVMDGPAKETRFPTLTLFVNEDLPIIRFTGRPNELLWSDVLWQSERVAGLESINRSFNLFLARQDSFRNGVLIHQLSTLH